MTAFGKRRMTLPVYPAPARGEVLSSYVIRLALANGLRPTRLTTVLGLPNFWKLDPDVSVTRLQLQVIAEATGLALDCLLETSVMPLLAQLHDNPRPEANPRFLVQAGKHRGVREARGYPVCPACVRETGVIQRLWRLTTTVVCDRHHSPLIDTCPTCQTPVNPVRIHRIRANRVRVMAHLPDVCPCCRRSLPLPEQLEQTIFDAAYRVQHLVEEAATTGKVAWGGFHLSALEFQQILESVLRLHYPIQAETGSVKWRPETSSVRERLIITIAGGQDLEGDLLHLFTKWRARGLPANRVLRTGGGLPSWYRHLILLSLATTTKGFPRIQKRCRTFRFTDRQWRVIAPVIPPVRRSGRHGRSTQLVLHAWFTRNLKGIRQKDWTGAWTGSVSYPSMYRRVTRMMADGVLDDVIEIMLCRLPECLPALTAPETVCSLFRMGSRHAYQVWNLMMKQAIAEVLAQRSSLGG